MSLACHSAASAGAAVFLALAGAAGCHYDTPAARAEFSRTRVKAIHAGMVEHLAGHPCSSDAEWERAAGDWALMRDLKGAQPRALDAWGTPYLMGCTPSGPYVISLGRDGRPRGEGLDADIIEGFAPRRYAP
jgi:hypothetical protein